VEVFDEFDRLKPLDARRERDLRTDDVALETDSGSVGLRRVN
jgi:hypothetical protein